MANLYLIDRPFGDNGLALAALDQGAVVVLIQDGVYQDTSSLQQTGASVYAIDRDLERRGLSGRVAGHVQPIDHSKLVDLIFESDKVINFA